MYQLQEPIYLEKQSNFVDMNNYPNLLTPPMDSPEMILLARSSDESNSSSHDTYMAPGYVQPFPAHLHGHSDPHKPYLTIVEQPVDRFRFRYKSEMAGTHGSLNGKNSDRSRKQTYPTVDLHNYDKTAIVRCSLYQWGRDEMTHTRLPHAHRLVKRQGMDELDDPHDMLISAENGFTATFHSMGIIHTAKKYIVPELLRKNSKLKQEEIARNEHKVRPLNKKEEVEIKLLCERESKTINLNIVCLRFDAFKVVNNIYYPLCEPVYTHSINNLKSALTGDLKIVRMDHCSSPSRGGREIFILVEKVTKKNIKVRFFELDDEDNETWCAYGKFNDLDVHHQYAIVFKTPPYRNLDIDSQVRVFIELQRPSDGARSEPKDFTYTPSELSIGRKRSRYTSSGYMSSNYSSDELPLTINHTPETINIDNAMVNSEDLEEALQNENINSDEFNNICELLLNSNASIKHLYGEDVTQEFAMDGSAMSLDCEKERHSVLCETSGLFPTKELEKGDQKIVEKAKNEIVAFLKTQPGKKRIIDMLEHIFRNPPYISFNTKDTILHLLVSENRRSGFFILLLKLLLQHRTTDLINIPNKFGKTALHLAVESYSQDVVEYLIYTQADISIQDMDGNSPLHVAVNNRAPITIVKLLLSPSNIKSYVDLTNNDGHTALHLAVKMNNIPAVKLLCWHQADVNADDKKNGYTALHMAVVDQNIHIIKFLLENTEIDPQREDYRQCSPLKLAKLVTEHDKPITGEIYSIIETFMKANGIFQDVDIKLEAESDVDVDEEIKDEPMSPQDLRTQFAKVRTFTEKCLNEVADILDESGTWQNLADLLDYNHLLRIGEFNSLEKPSKSLLEFAMANGESIQTIRDFLENLDEYRAVKIIDEMVNEETNK